MAWEIKDKGKLTVLGLAVTGVIWFFAPVNADGQTRPRPTPAQRVTPTPTPYEPVIISRAEDYPVNEPADDEEKEDIPGSETVEELRIRIAALESARSKDIDAVQRRLLLNLDILARSEQRSDLLRKQLFEMIEKENSVLSKLDQLEIESRPEMIERTVAMAGSLRPEEIRESRRKQLAAEMANLQSLLTEIRRNRTSLEQNLQRAEDLTNRLRDRVELEIDKALGEIDNEKP